MSFPVVVFGATECREFCHFDSRHTMLYWRHPDRGENRFPDPTCRVNGRTEVWDVAAVLDWAERTRERRGLVWGKAGLVKPEPEETE
jgi:hypothetical protein